MNWTQGCAAVVPSFNEGQSVGAVVRELKLHLESVFVVDDGSGDNTAAAAGVAGARVLRHTGNLGKGTALKTGLAAARAAGFAWAALLDGDGQHKAEDLPRLFQCAQRTGAALVVGDRMHNPAAMPWLRRQVNRWMSRKLSQRTGRCLPDSQCGFRLLNLEAWAGLRLSAGRFEVESEMLLAFLEAGYRVEFVPVQVVGRVRPSHIDPVRDTWRWFRWWHGLPQMGQSACRGE